MEKFFSRISSQNSNSSNVGSTSNPNPPIIVNLDSFDDEVEVVSKVDFVDMPADPGLRKSISSYDVNDREKVIRSYLLKGPCQPKDHVFPPTTTETGKRRFVSNWFKDHSWLEYSISKDDVFCLPCYLFKTIYGDQGGGDAFVETGFRSWNKKGRLSIHVGDHDSGHNKCVQACQDLMNQKQHIDVCLDKQSDQSRIDYLRRLTVSIDSIRFLSLQGLPFRGHDESSESSNQGNFIELLKLLAEQNEASKSVVLDNAPGNLKMTSHVIQKDIVNAIAVETTNVIISDLGGDLFTILVDEARDVSVKEQMAIVLRFVDDRGFIVERFLAVVHVADTTSLSLKMNVDALLCKHGLSISSLRGQGYDGASNMSGEFKGLKSLIMMENPSAYYVHCFAHQLQLSLVSVAQDHSKVKKFFYSLSALTNFVGVSCKRKDMLRDKSLENVVQGLMEGEICSGRGKNQKVSLTRAGATRWGSHYRSVVSLITLFGPTVDVLIAIGVETKVRIHRAEADSLEETIQCFEFVFCLFLMKEILGVSNDFSQALQRNDQDIVNAMTLVKITKELLQEKRNGGWISFWEEVASFCIKHEINVPNEQEVYVAQGRSRRNVEKNTVRHYYHFDIFNEVIDKQLQELNARFDEVNTELLLCMSCLDPSEGFLAFDKMKLIRFAEFYPKDFSASSMIALQNQLDIYIRDMRSNDAFANLKGISELSRKLVQLKKHRTYNWVYLLLKLALLLPVATATVERVFSAMKIVKSPLRNRLGDDVLNDCLVVYIESDIVKTIKTEDIIARFQNMSNRRMLL